MSLTKTLMALVFTGAIALTACSQSTTTQANSEPSPSATTAAQEPMPAMHHSMDNMSLGPKDESFDLRFIDAMIPHHEGAVLMAQEALEKSNRPEIRELAQAIIDAQNQEISQMKSWRSTWYPNVGDQPMVYHAEMGHMMPMSDEVRQGMMMSGDLGAADEEFDLRFINAMIPHHEGALMMAKEAKEKSDRPEIQEIAENILSSQQQEIDQMTQWRKDWYSQ